MMAGPGGMMAMPPGMMPPGPAGAGARMKVAVKPTQVGSPRQSADWDGQEVELGQLPWLV